MTGCNRHLQHPHERCIYNRLPVSQSQESVVRVFNKHGLHLTKFIQDRLVNLVPERVGELRCPGANVIKIQEHPTSFNGQQSGSRLHGCKGKYRELCTARPRMKILIVAGQP